MAVDSSIQRIVRLTPLSAVLALVESRIGVVQPFKCRLLSAHGHILAEDVVALECPPRPIALRDGFAVEAASLVDAGPYAPVPLASMPRRIDVGEPLPSGTDAVAPFDAVNIAANRVEAIAAVSPGDGVLLAGVDAMPHRPLRRAGECLRSTDVAVMAAAGIAHVTIRSPRIRIACGGARGSAITVAALDVLAHAIMAAGGVSLDVREDLRLFDEALFDAEADAVIAVGGTGGGRHDQSVQVLARRGRVEIHGIAVSPGETAAFGFVGARPVLIVPGRIDAALAIWLLVGRPLITRLAGGSIEDPQITLALQRKVTSSIGLTELVPVKCISGMAEPLACGYLPFEALTRADGWIVIPADSEGYPAGARVTVRPWP